MKQSQEKSRLTTSGGNDKIKPDQKVESVDEDAVNPQQQRARAVAGSAGGRRDLQRPPPRSVRRTRCAEGVPYDRVIGR